MTKLNKTSWQLLLLRYGGIACLLLVGFANAKEFFHSPFEEYCKTALTISGIVGGVCGLGFTFASCLEPSLQKNRILEASERLFQATLYSLLSMGTAFVHSFFVTTFAYVQREELRDMIAMPAKAFFVLFVMIAFTHIAYGTSILLDVLLERMPKHQRENSSLWKSEINEKKAKALTREGNRDQFGVALI